jgi:EmrB/QacA subfamily drug resistance transporter
MLAFVNGKGGPLPRTRLVPLIVACALFMENMDSTVIATSLPQIAAHLGESPIALKLALTSYLLSLAVFIPVSGWAADRFGARTVFRAAILVFTLGSILCGLSSTLFEFVGARILQGMGGAMMVPVGRLVIFRTVPKSELVAALAWLTIPGLLGPVIGPPLGGFITTYFSWRWIFWINVPIGVLGIVLVSRYIDNMREADVPPLDARGAVLSGLGLSGLVLGFSVVSQTIVPPAISASLLVVGAIATGLYVAHARRVPHPVLDLDLLRLPTMRAALVGGFFFRLGVGAIPFLLPLMLQLGFGYTAFQSGLLTCMAAAGAMASKTSTAVLLRRFGFRPLLIVSAIVAALLLAVNGLFRPETPYFVMAAALLVGGWFRSLLFTSLAALAFADVPRPAMSSATSLSSVAQQLALSSGVAAAALVLELASYFGGEPELSLFDFGVAFYVVGAISLASLAWFVRLSPTAGEEIAGRKIVAEDAGIADAAAAPPKDLSQR